MKLKKKIFIILLPIGLIVFLINVLLGWVPIPWSRTVYSSTYDNLIPIWDINYQQLLFHNASDCWDDLLVDVRTASKNDSLYKTVFPTAICFNFVTDKFHEDGEFVIKSIELKDRDKNKMELLYNSDFPIELNLKKSGNLYMAGFRTEEKYNLSGSIMDAIFVKIELYNTITNKTKIINTIMSVDYKCGLGYWRN